MQKFSKTQVNQNSDGQTATLAIFFTFDTPEGQQEAPIEVQCDSISAAHLLGSKIRMASNPTAYARAVIRNQDGCLISK